MTADAGYVLIVLDDDSRRDLLTSQLGELGYAAAHAASARAAIEAASARAADLVVIDASLPAETFAELRRAGPLQAAPILAIIHDDSPPDDRLLWADDFLQWPFTPTLLRARLNTLIHHSHRQERLRMERDIQIAREIQRGFLPERLPDLPGWQIAACFIPAYEVAGDFYDVFYLTNKIRTAFVVADVCDKGIGAALFMGLSRSLLRAFAQQNYTLNWADVLNDDPAGASTAPAPAAGRHLSPRAPQGRVGDDAAPGSAGASLTSKGRRYGRTGVGVTALKNAVTMTNNYIATIHGQANMFATLFFGVLDPATGLVNYVNAGHNPPLIVHAHGGVKARLTRTGPAVGMFADVDFGIEQAQIEPGETLLVFTDGVTEARSAGGDFFSDERLEALMRPACESAGRMLDDIQAALKQHVGDAAQSDDITLLALRRELSSAG